MLQALVSMFLLFDSNQPFVDASIYLQRIPNRVVAVKKVVVRTLKLLFWGLLLQG